MAAAATISTPLHLRPSRHAYATPTMRSLPFLRHRLRSLAVAAVQQDAAVWTAAPVSSVGPASADGSLFHLCVDLSDAANLASSFTAPGQYLMVRVPGEDELKPAFMAIASPPGEVGFEFLIKTVPGATAEKLCRLRDGDVVELGAVMGKGFPIERITPTSAAETVLLFATGTGISPIRSLIEFGFAANQRADVRLYYGARNLQTMAYQDRFTDWESTGLKIVPVLSQPDDSWKGERGYVQHAFLEAKNISNPSSSGAVLCGQKQMVEPGSVEVVHRRPGPAVEARHHDWCKSWQQRMRNSENQKGWKCIGEDRFRIACPKHYIGTSAYNTTGFPEIWQQL